MQSSLGGRVVTLVAVSGGVLKYAHAGDTAWSTPTNNTGETPPLNASGLIYSSDLGQKKYLVDGTNYVVFDPHELTLDTWAATSGELPQDQEGNYATLICTWRGRIVLSGLLLDPQDWFMSAVDDATDFNYSPDSITPTQAVAGQNGAQGLIGDVVTTLIPYTDDVLIFGGDSSIKMLRGDPMAGGQLDLVSASIGMVFGEPWCMDPLGTIYFYSNHCGVYSLVPGQVPKRISRQIDAELDDVNTGTNVFRLIWNDRQQGLHVFITPIDEPAPTTHYFMEARTGGWFSDEFENDNHNPLCAVTFDGNLPEDRVTLVGGWDGYIRALDHGADDDDGTPITSEVLIGPLLTKEGDDVLLGDMTAILSTSSGEVTCEVYTGDTAEEALENAEAGTDPDFEADWEAGRNYATRVARAGHAIYVKIKSTDKWAMEQLRASVEAKGKPRQRGK